jgi:hypothetical protein
MKTRGMIVAAILCTGISCADVPGSEADSASATNTASGETSATIESKTVDSLPPVPEIPFEVVRTWSQGRVILISPDDVNDNRMKKLGTQLRSKYGSTFVDIFNNKRAATELRQATRLSSKDEDFLNDHHVGWLRGNELVYYLPNIAYPANERTVRF